MILPDDYFARFAEYHNGCSAQKAFDKTEREFFKAHNCRRYVSYEAFRRGYYEYRKGRIQRVVLHLVETFEIKPK